jgi:hypothetical protein
VLFRTEIVAYSEKDRKRLGMMCGHNDQFLGDKAEAKCSHRSVLKVNAHYTTKECITGSE